MPQAARPILFADVMSKLGHFLFCWVSLETQLPQSIKRLRTDLAIADTPPLPNGIAKRLDLWQDLALAHPYHRDLLATVPVIRDQTLALRDIRNTIVHGLHSGGAGGGFLHHRHRPEPHIACYVGGAENPTGETVHYSLDDLEHFIQATDACRRAFEQLRNFNYLLHPLPAPLTDTTPQHPCPDTPSPPY